MVFCGFEFRLASLDVFSNFADLFPNSAFLVGHEVGIAPASRLDLEKNLSRILQRSYRAGH